MVSICDYICQNTLSILIHFPSRSLMVHPDIRMVPINNVMEPSGQTPHAKQAACLSCRRSKIRCNRAAGETRCEKCKQSDAECIVPSHHLGRQKGVKK